MKFCCSSWQNVLFLLHLLFRWAIVVAVVNCTFIPLFHWSRERESKSPRLPIFEPDLFLCREFRLDEYESAMENWWMNLCDQKTVDVVSEGRKWNSIQHSDLHVRFTYLSEWASFSSIRRYLHTREVKKKSESWDEPCKFVCPFCSFYYFLQCTSGAYGCACVVYGGN